MKVFPNCALGRRRKQHTRKWNKPGIADSLLLMMTAYLQIRVLHPFLVRSYGSVMVSNTSEDLPISIFRVEIHPPWRWRQQPYSKSSYIRVYARLSGIVFQRILTSDWHQLFVANQIVSVPIKFQTPAGNISETLCSHEYSRWWKRRYQGGDQQENLVVVLVFSCAVPSAVGWSN